MRTLLFVFIISTYFEASAWSIDVKESIKAVVGKPRDKLLRSAEAQKLLASATAKDVVTALLQVIQDDQEGVDGQAARRLLMALDPFPFEEMAGVAFNADDAVIRANALGFMNLGAKSPDELERVITEAKKTISDERVGISYHGDAKAHAPEGFRLCDIAYNILVKRLDLGEGNPLMDGSNFVIPDRNQLIDKLCSQLGLPLHKWSQAYPPVGNPATLALPKELSTQQFPESPMISHTATPDVVHEQTSQSWLTWLLVIIAATMGAVWLFLRKSK